MAWAKGTATDFVDFMRLLRDYAAGLIDPSTHPTITSGSGPVASTKAAGALTFTGQPADTETITIGAGGFTKTFTFQTTLTNVDGNVHIGASTAASVLNLIHAITLGSGSGTDYAAAMTASQWVTAAAGAGTSVTITALSGGQYGNNIATIETIANASFGAATLVGGVGWYIMPLGASMTALPGSGYATDGEFYLCGPGSDPADQIFIGAQSYRNAGANIYGFQLRGYTGYNPGLTFSTLYGVSPGCNTALDNASMSCWFWVNDRRIIAVARIGTTDILCHAGFIQQFGTRSQYPYPLLIAGSVSGQASSYQTNTFAQSSLPDPTFTACYLRHVDGSWQQYRNFTGASASRVNAIVSTGNVVWPQRNPETNADGSAIASLSEDVIFEGFSTGVAPYVSNTEIGAYQMMPTCLIAYTGAAAPDDYEDMGSVDGLMTIFGLGLNSADTLTDPIANVYDCFDNTWRSEPVDKYAMLRA